MKDQAPVSHLDKYYVNLVANAPKVAPSERTPDEEDGHAQFGNNLYFLFLSRLEATRAPDPQLYRREAHLAKTYLNRAESQHPTEWAQFLDHNGALIAQIDTALDGLGVYQKIKDYHADLLREGQRTGDWSKSEAFQELDLEGVGTFAWRQLNPLLEQAASRMSEAGIDPYEFFASTDTEK
jgi:hypothetical protein